MQDAPDDKPDPQAIPFDADWLFSKDPQDGSVEIKWSADETALLGFDPDPQDFDGITWSKAGKCYGPAAINFDDNDWQPVQLPHDWCVESKPDPDAPMRNGFLPTGIGWYRKRFACPPQWADQAIQLRFDGVFRNASVFVNGHLVAQNESGYAHFCCRLDPVLNWDGENVVSVRVDARSKEGWFYEGCGIYRHVHLLVSDKSRIENDGVHVDARVRKDRGAVLGDVKVRTELTTDHSDPRQTTPRQYWLRHQILNPDGKRVLDAKVPVSFDATGTCIDERDYVIDKPGLWTLDQPTTYTLTVELLDEAGRVLDQRSTTMGFRHVRFDAQTGFYLNGKPVKLQGVCCHQDHAGVGSAMPDLLQWWRLKQLKAMGVNAYRCAHNPPAPELLRMCDALGIVVIVEARCFGIAPAHLTAVEAMVRMARNHPCVILWSLANEEMHVQVTDAGRRMLNLARQAVLQHDSSRGITTAVNVGWDDAEGFIQSSVVHGLNYLNQGDLERLRDVAPDVPVIVSEASSAVSTRGVYEDDPDAGHVQCYDRHDDPGPHPSVTMWPYWGRSAADSWQVVANRPDLAGTFVWTGFDYRGEQSPYVCWPNVGSHFGIMDLCGFPKDAYWYYRSWWSPHEKTLHLLPHWNWSGREGEKIDVWVYSNAARVELLLNGRVVDESEVPPNRYATARVAYQPGRLVARATWADGTVREHAVATTGSAAQLHADVIGPDPEIDPHTAIVNLRVCDADGRTVPTANLPLDFQLEGGGALLGLGNGDPTSHEIDSPGPHTGQRRTFNGLAQAILRVTHDTELLIRCDLLGETRITFDHATQPAPTTTPTPVVPIGAAPQATKGKTHPVPVVVKVSHPGSRPTRDGAVIQ
ncbi:MAG: glycoside hydrolase family 2 TIM barrel-domain containing protein [Planctomycetota bacterium]